MDQRRVDDYLDRIGLATRPGVGEAGLHDLVSAHLRTVPFENLSIHLGEEVRLDEEGLLDKLVGRRRGGFCYELGGAFAALLRALGYEVTLLAARVHGASGLGPPYDHLALRVDLPAGPWLADVGFGRFLAGPAPFAASAPHEDPLGTVTWHRADEGDLDVVLDGRPQYRLETRPRTLADFVTTCWWHQTSPRSHFTRGPVCSLPTADGGRVSLTGRSLVETAPDGTRTETTVGNDDSVLAAYREHFGISLDRIPGERPRR